MRNLKKVLALVIAFSMMLSVVAFAGYKDVEADADYADAVELLSALEIFQGDENGNFNPDNTVTRAEMAAIVCRALGLEAEATDSMGATKFADVGADHWASGYVNLAVQKGIIDGFPDGTFKPSDVLTYEQAIKMLVCAIDFERVAEDEGGFPDGYVEVAEETAKITKGAAANAKRGNLAVIVYNAIHAPMLDQTKFGDSKDFEILDGKDDKAYKTLLTERDIYIASGVVGAKTEDVVAFDVKEASDDKEFKAGSKNFKIGESDIAAYTYNYVDAYVVEYAKDKYEAIAVIPSTIGETLTIVSDDIAAVGADKLEYYIDAANSSKTKKIEFATKVVDESTVLDVTFVYNKGTSTSFDALADLDPETDNEKVDDCELTFIENDGDGKFDVVIGTKYTSYRVDSVEADRDRITYDEKTVKFDFENEDVTYIFEDMVGNAITLADFAEDDVIAVVTDGANAKLFTNYIKIVKLSDAAVTGAVSERWNKDGVKYVTIDGKDYVDATEGGLDATAEGTFYIGMTGKIIDFEGVSKAGNYGYILEAGQSSSAFSDTWQVKILTANDGVVTYDVDEDIITATAGDDLAAKNLLVALDETDNDKFDIAWAAPANKTEATARFVEFDTNSKGLIDEIGAADGTLSDKMSEVEYKASTQKLGSKYIEDDVAILYLAKTKADDVYKADISYLVDEGVYEGYVFKDSDDLENCVVLITKGVGALKAEGGFAIATKVTSGETDGQEFTKVSYVKGEEEGVVTFNKDSENTVAGGLAYSAIDMGDIFLFNANAEGAVTEYAVLAEYKDTNADPDEKEYDFVINAKAAEAIAANAFGKEVALKTGYLYSKNNKSLNIATSKAVDAAGDLEEIIVPSAAFKYTYNGELRNHKIEIGDYQATSGVDFWASKDDASQTHATPVIYLEIEEEVTDIYTAHDAVEVDFEEVAAE